MGVITRSRASLWTADAIALAAHLLMDSRAPDEWRGQGEAYCKELYPRLQRLMNSQHVGLGERVVDRWRLSLRRLPEPERHLRGVARPRDRWRLRRQARSKGWVLGCRNEAFHSRAQRHGTPLLPPRR